MRGLFLYIVLLTCLSPIVSAQNLSTIDSLKLELKRSSDDQKPEILNQIGWEHRLSHPDSTIFYCQKAISAAEVLKQPIEATKALNFIGLAYVYKGSYGDSYDHYTRALEQATVINDTAQIAYAYNNLGRLYLYHADPIKSYDYFFNALNLFEQLGNKKGMGYCYQSLVNLYDLQNDNKKAIEMAQNALDIRIELDNKRGQVSSYQELAFIYQKIDLLDSAQAYYLKAQSVAASIDDRISLAEVDLGLAHLYLTRNELPAALTTAEEALAVSQSANNRDLTSRIYLELGKIYLAQQRLDEAEYYLTLVTEFSKKAENFQIEKDAYYCLSRLYEQQNRKELALNFYQKYVVVKDSLRNVDNARAIEKLEARLEIEKRENESRLRHAEHLLIIKQEKAKNIGLLVITGLILILLGFVWYNSKKRKIANRVLCYQKEKIEMQSGEIRKQNGKINEQNEKLKRRNDELAELNAEKDNLMSIVAHDLKSPFNKVKGLLELIKLSGSLNDEQSNYLTITKEVSLTGVNLIRDLLDVNEFGVEAKELQITKIDASKYLAEKIESYKAEFDFKNIKVHLTHSDEKVEVNLDELYFSRILDNLISNAIKYSEANTNVYLSAYYEDGHAHISIKDEGQGFSEEDKKHLYKKFQKLSAQPTAGESSNGLGLAIVKILVDRLGGEIKLISEKGKGSEFIISFSAKQTKQLQVEA
ncbi:MAG: tetratricopeptide repeat protein [Bacteroidota bacterium]